MGFKRVQMIQDRFTAEFSLLENGDFQDWIEDQSELPFNRKVRLLDIKNVLISKEDWEFIGSDVERDAYVTKLYKPPSRPSHINAKWVVTGYAAYIDTYNTESGDLEPNQMWEGERDRINVSDSKEKKYIIKWKDDKGELHEGSPNEVEIKRSKDEILSIERKK